MKKKIKKVATIKIFENGSVDIEFQENVEAVWILGVLEAFKLHLFKTRGKNETKI